MRRLLISSLILSSFPFLVLYSSVYASIPEFKPDNSKINKRKSTKIIWKKISDYNDTFDRKLIWKKIDYKEQLDLKKKNTLFINNENKEKKINTFDKQIELDLLDLGRSVPKPNTIRKGDIRIIFTQISPIKKAYYGGGTGNQNYLASIYYGLADSLMIEGFYSHSDDPLQKKITIYDAPVDNRWISYGTSLTWQFIKNNNLLFALNTSIENWNVKSGGCNTYNCNSTSNNIFNNEKVEVLNNNVVGSVSLPLNYNLTEELGIVFVPRVVFLPSNQSNEISSGKFYGSSFGIGTGIEYKLLENIKSYGSLYFPIGSGFNSFDENLVFDNKTIYNAGIIYSIDANIALEASLTNGFGLSPSTGILSLPSSDELLYKTSLIYRPRNITLPEKKSSKQNRVRFGGLSVSNAESLGSGEVYANAYLNNNGSWANKIAWGASNRFDFDISISSIGQNSFKDKPFEGKYHTPDKLFVRGGGKATFLSQANGDFMTSSARVSAGRLRGTGWLFTELINTYNFNDNLTINFNPKVSFSGIASPAAIGTSLNWQIVKDISLIPEYNFSVKESTNNMTFAIRISRFKNMNFDVFTTNSLNFIDTGQLQRSDSQSYGVNVGFIF